MSPLALRLLLWAGLTASALLLVWGIHQHGDAQGYARARTEVDEQHAKQLAEARQAERDAQARVDALAAKYEQERHRAELEQATLVADLRSGAVRFRRLWQGCEAATARVPSDPGAAGVADGEADDRADSASRIVRAARACDAQVIGLQDYIRAIR